MGKKTLCLFGVCLGLILVLNFVFCGGRSSDDTRKRLEGLNVILITIDTLRADYVSAYEKGKSKTPHLDRLASEGVLFEKCISQVPLTLPSHVTLLSGTYPFYHGVRDIGGFTVPRELRLVSEVLQDKGFSTSAFIAAFVLHSKWGINQGFDTYSDNFDRSKYEMILLQNEKPAEEVLEEAKTWLLSHKSSRFFTWIHLFEPHSPYTPPLPFNKYPDDPYRGEVEYVDHVLGGFMDFLGEQRLDDKTLIIITSDHGEGLGQHREQEHGYYVYDPTVWVPLIMRAPFPFPTKRVPDLVELVDVAPTILDALRIPIPESYQGESLLTRMFGEEGLEEAVAYTETFYPRWHYGWSELKAMYRGNWKYILAPDEELFELAEDPGEVTNLAVSHSDERRELKERIRNFVEVKSRDALTPTTEVLDEEDRQRLQALGYVTDFAASSSEGSLPDPKSKYSIFNALARASDLANASRYDEAIDIANEVVANDSGVVRAYKLLGICYRAKRMSVEALINYRKVLELKPDDNFAMTDIVAALLNLDEFDEAIDEAETFLEKYPGDNILLEMLGLAYFYKEDYDIAAKFLAESISVEKSSSAISKLGEIYALRKDYAKAESLIEQALRINPKSKNAYYTLALVEEAKGEQSKAIDYYIKELENYPDDYRASYNLANNLREKGDHDEALEYYRRTVQLNPGFKMAYFMVAKYDLDRNVNLQEAIELSKKGIEIQPADEFTLLGYQILTDIYAKLGDRNNYEFYLAKGDELYRTLEAKGQVSIR